LQQYPSLCTKEQAYKHCGINEKRLNRLQNSGFIKQDNIVVKGKSIDVIRLDRKGIDYTKLNLEKINIYRGNLNEAVHNLKLTETYYQILEKNPNIIWLNESELMVIHHDKLIDRSCVDGMYIQPDGTKCAVEVIGEKYTKKMIADKKAVAEMIADKAIYI
jgi:hypothetical protein